MKKRLLVLFIIILCLLATGISPLLAQSIPTKPTQHIYVQDYAGLLTEATEQEILQTGKALDEATSAQVVMVTVESLDNMSIEDYANTLFRSWGIGDKEKDNGVLFLISKNDRQSRVEVGYGLEGRLNDAKTGRIQDEAIPYFKNGDFDRGVSIIFNLLVGEVCQEYNIENLGTPVETDTDDGIPWFFWLIVFAVIVVVIAGIALTGGGGGSSGDGGGTSRRYTGGSSGRGFYGGGFGGGSSGGGFGGFGGGSSGGGGSSRGW